MPIFANIIEQAFSPLISVFESIMVFIHAHLVGGSWGLAIVGLTVVIRAVLVPLTYKQLKSMQEMQRLAPEINELKEKYKDDKQRQQQEIMKFYQENKINPLASCLPFVLQLPVFISLFYMLRTDLKLDICGPQLTQYLTATAPSSPHSDPRTRGKVCRPHSRSDRSRLQRRRAGLGQVPVHPRHHLQGDRRGVDRADRPLHRLADRLDADGDRHGRPEPAAPDAGCCRWSSSPSCSGIPAGCWCTGSPPTCGRSGSSTSSVSASDRPAARKAAEGRRSPPTDERSTARPPALAAAGVCGGTAAVAPPPPPRKKKKRSGRRR